MSTNKTARDNELIKRDAASTNKKARVKKINQYGAGANAAASPNAKRVETGKVEISELTQDAYEDLHRESCSEEDKDCVLSRKNSKKRRYELPSKQNQDSLTK